MKYFFKESHLNEILNQKDGILYAFDFDGTLAPIRAVPSEAKLPKETRSLLKKISKLVPVAIISGRSVKDLKSKIPKEIPILIGNHGLEGFKTKKTQIQKARVITERWEKELKAYLQGPQTDIFQKVELEAKTYSLSLHYRLCRNKPLVRKKLLQKIKSLSPSPKIVTGKAVINVLPADSPDKGKALMELLNKMNFSKALFVGDDKTDEDVFILKDPRIASVQVGSKRKSAAAFYLKQQAEIDRLLKVILAHHSSK